MNLKQKIKKTFFDQFPFPENITKVQQSKESIRVPEDKDWTFHFKKLRYFVGLPLNVLM